MNGPEVNPNTNRVTRKKLMIENLFEYRYTIKTVRNLDALYQFEFEEILA